MSIPIRRYACSLFLLALTPHLRAQEMWDTSIQLVVGSCGAATDAGLGQKTNFGGSLTGAYPAWSWGGVVFEGGYRAFTPATTMNPAGSLECKAHGIYAGSWLHKLPRSVFDGAYAQVGLRAWQMVAVRNVTLSHGNPDGTDRRVESKGPRSTVIKPGLGIGYRFNDHLSTELVFSNFGAQDVQGNTMSGTIMEFSLGLHL